MFGIDTLFILTQSIVLMALLYLLARKEADLDFANILITMCGVILGNFMLVAFGTKQLGFFVIIPVLVFTCWMVKSRFDLSWVKGGVITVLYFIISSGIEVGKSCYFYGRMPWEQHSSTDAEPQNKYDESVQEGMKAFNDLQEASAKMNEAAQDPASATKAKPATPPAVATPGPVPEKGKKQPKQVVAVAPPPVAQAATAPVVKLPPTGTVDWDLAKSQLRLRGWVTDIEGNKSAMLLNGTSVSVGGTTYVDMAGNRYTWTLVQLEGYQPTWQPTDVSKTPKEAGR